MMRAWIGLALLAVSWLLGLDYYQPARWPGFAAAIGLGTVLLAGRPSRRVTRREMGLALAMLVPGVWFMPWPYRAAPLLISVGLALQLLPIPRRWPEPLGWGAVKAGTVLLGQSLALLAYTSHTARCHDLPWPLPSALGMVARLLGMDAAVDGKTIALHSMRQVHRIAATWDLLLDSATWCFFIGGLILLAFVVRSAVPEGKRLARWCRAAQALAAVVVAWLPVRAGLLMALYVHRALRAEPTPALTVMNQFLSPGVHLLLLAGPVLLARWFVRMPAADSSEAEAADGRRPDEAPATEGPATAAVASRGRYAWALALVFASVATVSFVLAWDPVGSRKDGRVMFVERHSTWEPTDRAYDKDHFGHDPSYSYTKIYEYLSQFYETSRLLESDEIGQEKLNECDVLVVKIPTARFSAREVDAITRFVERGGGLLLIGDHTNVFHSSTYLNDISRPFGFAFRHDLLFCIGSPYDQKLSPPAVPHPVVQHLPPMYYAVSCSIDPGRSRGRAVVQRSGLWNLPPNYHTDNYHPEAEYRPEMRYGPFIQLWATRHGDGRVLAFTDSTIFSNFSVFQPGKAELMLGMVEWLNRRSMPDRGGVRLLVAGVALLAALVCLVAGGMLSRRGNASWLVLVGAGVLGWTAACAAAASAHRWAMPPPEAIRPMSQRMRQVVIDRTVSDVPLSLGAFTQGEGRGYGLLEQWIPRLGPYYTQRAAGQEAFSGEALVVLCPTRSVTDQFREGLVEYVARGGKVLIVDSPGVVGSTANSLLWPFGMESDHAASRPGKLRLEDGWPGIELGACCEISGGEPILWVDETPVAARARHGRGSVIALGVGAVFSDAGMGREWTTNPDAELLTRFDLLFALLEAVLEDRPPVTPPPRPGTAEETGTRPSDTGPESD